MAEIHYSIPGLEHVLHRNTCEDKVYRVFFSSKLTKDLAKKYYTATAFFSLKNRGFRYHGRPIIRTLIKQSFTHE